MDDKTRLLDQLRINRSQVAKPEKFYLRWSVRIALLGAVVLAAGAGLWFFSTVRERIPVHTAVAKAVPVMDTSTTTIGSLLDASGYVVALREATVSAKAIYKVTQVMVQE